MAKVYLGIDNGITASIGILGLASGPQMTVPPIKKQLNYHKKASNISRIDYPQWYRFLSELQAQCLAEGSRIFAILEKPFTGMAHTAVLSGRCYEAEVIALEELGIAYETICSTDWQGTKKSIGLLPEGLKGSKEQKIASKCVGIRLFPELEAKIKKHGDADGLLIAEWARRKGL